ncbi:MAG: hypothetical protein M3362_16170, partial [Acidobacteriota bacterium]|nr:hypothetical protein [Acidobacteriota bacterium]
MAREKDDKKLSQTGSQLLLWTGVLLAPFVWSTQMEVNYLLVPYACMTGHRVVLYLVTLVALILAAAGGLISWRNWQEAGREMPDDAGDARTRSRFMALLGLLTSAMFFVVILAQGIPN